MLGFFVPACLFFRPHCS